MEEIFSIVQILISEKFQLNIQRILSGLFIICMNINNICFRMNNITANNKVFLPYTANYVHNKQGLAMVYKQFSEDLENTSWYFWWGSCGTNPNQKCVPLNYGYIDSALNLSYDGYMLVFNEPNNVPPYGNTETPYTAYDKYMFLRSLYPNAKFILGNVTLFGISWMQELKNIIT